MSRSLRGYLAGVGFAAFALGIGTMAAAQTVTVADLVSSVRVDRTTFDYTYRIRVLNGAAQLDGVVARVTSTAPTTVILDGEVSVGPLAPNANIVTTDTFTLRQNRSAPFNPAALQWQVSGTPVEADLDVVKTGPVNAVVIGTPFAYTVTLRNRGPADATDVLLVDEEPVGLRLTAAVTSFGDCTLASPGVRCTFDEIPAGEPREITIGAVGTELGTHTNCVRAEAAQPDPGGDAVFCVPTTVVSPPPILISLDPSSIVTGSTAFELAVYGDNFDPGAVVDFGAPELTPIAIESGGSIAPQRIRVVVSADFVTQPGNPLVRVRNPNGSSSGGLNFDVMEIPPTPHLELTLEDSTDPVPVDGEFRYNAIVTNVGTTVANSVRLHLRLSLVSGILFTSADSAFGDCELDARTVECLFPAIPAGQSVLVQAGARGVVPGIHFNCPLVEAFGSDPNEPGHPCISTTVVRGTADLRVTVPSPPLAFVVNGGTLGYTVTLTNAGPDAATNIVLNGAVSGAGASIELVDVEGGTCTAIDDAFECTIERLSPDETRAAIIEVLATTEAVVSLTTGAMGEQEDPTPEDAHATATTAVYAPLEVTAEGTLPTMFRGQLFSYAGLTVEGGTGGPVTFTLGPTTPPFLSIDEDGIITGTVPEDFVPGGIAVRVTVTQEGPPPQSAEVLLELNIRDPLALDPPRVRPGLSDGEVGTTYSDQIVPRGGVAPLFVRLLDTAHFSPFGEGAAGTPCEGLFRTHQFDGTVTVEGTPVRAGDCGPFEIRATDSDSVPNQVIESYTVHIAGLPVADDISPSSAVVGSADVSMLIVGEHFVAGAVVLFGGVELTPSAIGPDAIVVTIPASLLAEEGNRSVVVRNPNGRTTNALDFEIEPPLPEPTTLSIVKTGPRSVPNGEPIPYTIVVTNVGDVDAEEVSLTDELFPGSVDAVPATVSASAGTSCEILDDLAGDPSLGLLRCETAELGPGESIAVSFELTVIGTEPYTNHAEAFARGSGGFRSNDVTTTRFDPATAPSVDGIAPSSAIVDSPDLPDVLIIGENFAAGAVVLFGGVELTPDSIGPNAITFTIPAALLSEEGVRSAVVRNPDGGESDPISFEIEPPLPEPTTLSVVKTGPASVATGAAIPYTITVTNTGTVDAMDVSVLDDLFPGRVDLVAGTLETSDGTTCEVLDQLAGDPNFGLLDCETAALAPGESITVSFELTVTGAEPYTNHADAFARGSGGFRSNDVTTTRGGAGGEVTLSVSKTGPASVAVGAEIPYSITITNTGDTVARDLEMHDVLARYVTVVPGSIAANADSCFTRENDESGYTLIALLCRHDRLDPGETITVEFTAATTSGTQGPVDNIAHVVALDPLTDFFSSEHVVTQLQPAVVAVVNVLENGLLENGIFLDSNVIPDNKQFAVSATGRYVVFTSFEGRILLRDTCEGDAPEDCLPSTRAVTSATPTSTRVASNPSISADGRWVAFRSNRAGEDPDSPWGPASLQFYLHDTCIGVPGCTPSTRLMPARLLEPNPQFSRGVLFAGNIGPLISADGSRVVFSIGSDGMLTDEIQSSTSAVLLYDRDPDGNGVFDEFGNTVNRVLSRRPDGSLFDGSDFPTEAAISGDGNYVALAATGLPGGRPRIFLRSVVGQQTIELSRLTDANASLGIDWQPDLSFDGAFMAYVSSSVFGTLEHVFRMTTCAAPTGSCDRDAVLLTLDPDGFPIPTGPAAGFQPPSVSASGRIVTFSHFSNGLDDESDFAFDVFAWDTCLGATDACTPQLRNLTGRLPSGDLTVLGSHSPRLSANGEYLVFMSLDPFLPEVPAGKHVLYLMRTGLSERPP